VWQVKGWMAGSKARLASLRRDVSGQLQGRSGVETLRRLGAVNSRRGREEMDYRESTQATQQTTD
jgi:hypothetical protein